MKLIKLGAISLVFMAMLIIGMSLFIPSHTRVSRAISIQVPAAAVNAYLSDFRNWQSWNELLLGREKEQLQSAVDRISGPELLIERQAVSDTLITSLWKSNGKNAISSGFSLTAYDSSSTVVQWYFDFQVNWYPWEKFSSILFDRQLGPLMEKSLDQLKKSIDAE